MANSGIEARIHRIRQPKARVTAKLMMLTTTFTILMVTLTALSACKRREVVGTPTLTNAATAEAATATNTPPADMAYSPSLEKRPCETYNPNIGEKEGESYFCGVMIVPQDRDQPDGEQIEIKYAILKSTSESPRSDPIVLLSGGPGNSALYPDAFEEMADRFGPMRRDRDIILFDQRGVGASTPQLDCAVVSPPDESHRADLMARYLTETGIETLTEDNFQVDCVLGLWDQGIELSNFTSSTSAADTVDLLHALHEEYGYANFNLYAISYGTWLAETVVRDHPEESLIRTLLFDSVFPRPKSEYIADFYIDKYGMLEHLFAACAADPACDQAFPDLRQRFLSLVEDLNATPLPLPNETELDGDRLYQSIYPFVDRGANWVNVIPYLPRMISDLELGQTDTFIGVTNGTLPPPTSDEYTPPDVVYDMLEIRTCTSVPDQHRRNDLYRQMYNVSIQESRDIINELCGPEEIGPFLERLESMTPRDVNELVKRLYLSPIRGTSPTMRTHFNCSETFPFGEDQATIGTKMRHAGMPEFLTDEAKERIPQAVENCGVWPAKALPASSNEPVGSNYPALFISGEWDYVTFPNWAEEAHGRWPNSFYLFVPNGMHSVIGNFGECPTAVTLQFLDDPADEPDMSCTEALGVEWVLSEQ
jgi:pimeloyl-ACP methyl ester carboxylesterase